MNTVKITEQDREFMREAIQLANESVKNGGGPFGAVVVKDGKVVAGSSNSVTIDNDPTAHPQGMQQVGHIRPIGLYHLHFVRALSHVPGRHLLVAHWPHLLR